MIQGLTQVLWDRMDVSFQKSRQRYIAHNTIQHDTSDDDVQLMFTVSSSNLDVWRFGGLFLITGTISISSIMLYIGIFIRKEFNAVDGRGSIWDKMAAWARHYDGFKDDSSKNKRRDQKLSYEDAVNTDDGLLQLSGHLGKSDVSAANFASPERVVVSGCYDKHNRGFVG